MDEKLRLAIKIGASAVSAYAVYNIYTILKKQKEIDSLENDLTKKTVTEEISKTDNTEEFSCSAGDGCCQTTGAGDCGTGSGEQREHVFGEYNSDDDEDNGDDNFSIAGSQDGPLLDIEDLGTAAVEQMDNGSDDNGSQDSGVMIHKKNEDLIEKFKNHKEMVDDTVGRVKV